MLVLCFVQFFRRILQINWVCFYFEFRWLQGQWGQIWVGESYVVGFGQLFICRFRMVNGFSKMQVVSVLVVSFVMVVRQLQQLFMVLMINIRRLVFVVDCLMRLQVCKDNGFQLERQGQRFDFCYFFGFCYNFILELYFFQVSRVFVFY